MYAAAKRLDVSDVKLALDSSTGLAGAKGVSVFDVIMVQVGRRSEGEDMVFERVGAALVYNTKLAWLDKWEKCVATLV